MKPNVFMAAGIALIFFGLIYPMVTVVIDTTPPKWTLASDGEVAIYPRDGQTYTEITQIQAGVEDLESGVKSVTAVIDNQDTYPLTRYLGTEFSGMWIVNIPALSSGQHTMTLTAENNNGLKSTYTATFTIYTELQGDWYINDIKITDPNQVLRFNTTTLTFKFVKTAGIDDSKISCTIWEGDDHLLTLTYVSTNTWKGSYTFEGGTHTLTLKAYDQIKEVSMKIVNLEFESKEEIHLPDWLNLQMVMFIIGGVLVAYSFIKRD